MISNKWVVEVGKDEHGYLALRINPDLTIRDFMRWKWRTFSCLRELRHRELLAVIERALVDPAGQYIVYSHPEIEPLWLRSFTELSQ